MNKNFQLFHKFALLVCYTSINKKRLERIFSFFYLSKKLPKSAQLICAKEEKE